jgi:hypothetical protein
MEQIMTNVLDAELQMKPLLIYFTAPIPNYAQYARKQ